MGGTTFYIISINWILGRRLSLTVLYPLIRITTIYHELWAHPTDRFHHHSPLAELPRPSPIPLRQMNHNDSLAFRIIKQYAVFAHTITLSFRLPFSVWYYLSGRLNFDTAFAPHFFLLDSLPFVFRSFYTVPYVYTYNSSKLDLPSLSIELPSILLLPYRSVAAV